MDLSIPQVRDPTKQEDGRIIDSSVDYSFDRWILESASGFLFLDQGWSEMLRLNREQRDQQACLGLSHFADWR